MSYECLVTMNTNKLIKMQEYVWVFTDCLQMKTVWMEIELHQGIIMTELTGFNLMLSLPSADWKVQMQESWKRGRQSGCLHLGINIHLGKSDHKWPVV